MDRGINRFLALNKVLDLLDERPEVRHQTGFVMPKRFWNGAWTATEELKIWSAISPISLCTGKSGTAG